MAEKKESKSGGGGMIALLVPLLLAIGGGAGLGLYIGEQQKKTAQASKDQPAATAPVEAAGAKNDEADHGKDSGHGADAHAGEGGGEHGSEGGHGDGGGHGAEAAHDDKGGHKDAKGEPPPKLQLKVLPPILANLGEPATALVRLQSAIVYDPAKLKSPDVFAAELSEDIIAFFKTVSMSSIEGAEGLRQLNEELKDRAAIRSNQAVNEFIIQSVVVQ